MLPQVNATNPIGSISIAGSMLSATEKRIRELSASLLKNSTNVSRSFMVVMDNISDQLQEASRSSNSERIDQLKTFDYLLSSIKKIEFNSKEEKDIAMAAYHSALQAMKENTSLIDRIGSDLVDKIGDVTGMLSNIFSDMPPIFGYLSTRIGDFASNILEKRKTRNERVDKLQSEISSSILYSIEPIVKDVSDATDTLSENNSESLEKLIAIQENTEALVDVWEAQPKRAESVTNKIERIETNKEKINNIVEPIRDTEQKKDNVDIPVGFLGKFTRLFGNIFSKGLMVILKTALLLPLGVLVASGLGYIYKTFEEKIDKSVAYVKESYNSSIEYMSDLYDSSIKGLKDMYSSFTNTVSTQYEEMKKSVSDNFVNPIITMFKDLFKSITEVLPDWMKEILNIPTSKQIEDTKTKLDIKPEQTIPSIENSVKYSNKLIEELAPKPITESIDTRSQSYKEMNAMLDRDGYPGLSKTVNSNVQSVVSPVVNNVVNNNSYTNRLITVSDPMGGLAAGASR